jgi:hypothetical protein
MEMAIGALLLLLLIAWIVLCYWIENSDSAEEAISALSLVLLK